MSLESIRAQPAGLFGRARWTVGVALAFTLAAMVRYPGGTPLDRATERYSLSRNFLSDLGMTVAYDGRPNRLGAGFFVLSLLILLVGMGSCLVVIARLLARQAGPRRWARLAGVCTFLACAAFAGVAVTPENRVMALHVSLTIIGWRIVAIVAGLMALAAAQSTLFRRRVTVVLSLLTVLLLAYAALLTWGPDVLSASGLPVQVIAQKCAAIFVITSLMYVTREADQAGPRQLT